MRRRIVIAGALIATTCAVGFSAFKVWDSTPINVKIAPLRPDEVRADPARKIPIRLTSSDGTGLRLAALRAKTAIEDPLSLTELHLTFENPDDRVREGTFHMTLPESASLSRFAVKDGGEKWQEAIVIGRSAAQETFEEAKQKNAAPALLEQSAGNEISAQISNIEPHGKREVIVTYSEVLEAGAPYVLPLRDLPSLGTLDIEVHAQGSKDVRWAVHQTSLTPAEDFVVAAEKLPRSAGRGSGELAIARVVPFGTPRPDPITSVLFMVDTSASRALGLKDEARLLDDAIHRLPPDAEVAVACFDQDVAVIFEGKASVYGARETAAILERGALGASDFGEALDYVAKRATTRQAKRIVFLTDGVSTAGEADPHDITRRVERLREANVERVDAIVVGGLRDEPFLRSMVHAGLARDGVVLDAKIGVVGVTTRLAEQTSSGIPIKVEGATWWWPRTLDGLQAGDEVVIHAELTQGANGALRVNVGGQEHRLPLIASSRALVERSWARAKIQSLAESHDPAARAQIIELGTKHRVVSPFTSMVLVGDGVAEGKGDILTVEGGRVAVQDEESKPSPADAPDLSPPSAAPSVANEKKEALRKARPVAPRPPPPPRPTPKTPPVAKDQLDEQAARKTQDHRADDERRPTPNAKPRPMPAPTPLPSPMPLPSPTATTSPAKPTKAATPQPAPPPAPPPAPEPEPLEAPEQPALAPPPYEGRFKTVMDLLARGQHDDALKEARAWRAENPEELLALVALGEALEANSDIPNAARAYGSLIELYPTRADARSYAGERLERLRTPLALRLAIDSFDKVVTSRPREPSGYRLLGFALAKSGDHKRAFETLATGRSRTGAPDLGDDLAVIAASWTHADPSRAREIKGKLEEIGVAAETTPSLRFILLWEGDRTEADLHVFDGRGGHASHARPSLRSGGELHGGRGAACFLIPREAARRSYPYTLQATLHARGALGYGLGKIVVIDHDGSGNVTFEDRPFLVMTDNAMIDLGKAEARTPHKAAAPSLPVAARAAD